MDKYERFKKLKEKIEGVNIEMASEEEINELLKDLENLENTININEDTILQKELENCKDAVENDLKNIKVDNKTKNFLILSEYLHAYNNAEINKLYENFKSFDKEEFKAIIIYNIAIQNGDTDDVFDLAKEEGFEAINIKEYAKMLKHNFPEYKEIDAELEKELAKIKLEAELEM